MDLVKRRKAQERNGRCHRCRTTASKLQIKNYINTMINNGEVGIHVELIQRCTFRLGSARIVRKVQKM